MAKESKSLGFSKACITEEDGVLIITETTKDSTNVYNLSDKIKEWIGIEGISLVLKKDSEIVSEE
jgi:hypothetical protein